jgi:hypothetical protein
MKEHHFYYIQDTRQIVGNCLLWYAENGRGYTCNINRAHVFRAHEIEKIVKEGQGKYRAWPKTHVDANISSHVDMQHIDREKSIGYNEEENHG